MTNKLYSYDLIEALCNAFGPSGCEDAVADLICEQTSDLEVETYRDRMGNVICHMPIGKTDADSKKLMISSHMDEVGFMVSEITEKGYLKFSNIGGIMTSVISGKHVSVGDEKSQVNGVIASKPIHLKSAEDRLKTEKEEAYHVREEMRHVRVHEHVSHRLPKAFPVDEAEHVQGKVFFPYRNQECEIVEKEYGHVDDYQYQRGVRECVSEWCPDF